MCCMMHVSLLSSVLYHASQVCPLCFALNEQMNCNVWLHREKLKSLYDTTNPWHETPSPAEEHKLWVTGKSTEAHRVLMPLHFLYQIMQKSYWNFNEQGRVEAGVRWLEIPHASLFIIREELVPLRISDLGCTSFSFKTLEFNLDFKFEMHRFTINLPRSKAVPRVARKLYFQQYLQQWWTAIFEEKGRQYHKCTMPAYVPFNVQDVWQMPIVVWICKERRLWIIWR